MGVRLLTKRYVASDEHFVAGPAMAQCVHDYVVEHEPGFGRALVSLLRPPAAIDMRRNQVTGAGERPRTRAHPMWFYRALLRLYPRSFRVECERELCAAFGERMRGYVGPLAPVVGVLVALGDVVPNAVAAHAAILARDLRVVARHRA